VVVQSCGKREEGVRCYFISHCPCGSCREGKGGEGGTGKEGGWGARFDFFVEFYRLQKKGREGLDHLSHGGGERRGDVFLLLLTIVELVRRGEGG